jgi:hypothetical protein
VTTAAHEWHAEAGDCFSDSFALDREGAIRRIS